MTEEQMRERERERERQIKKDTLLDRYRSSERVFAIVD